MAYSEKEKDKIFDYLCKEIEKGRSQRSVLREKGMPSSSTISIWLRESEDKSKQYAYAMEQRAEMIFEDILAIADDNSKDTYVNDDGIELTNHDVINRARLRIDSRKWILAKMIPKKYGDKIDHSNNGGSFTSEPPKVIFQAPPIEENE